MFVSKPKSKKNRWIEWKTFQGYLKNKKEKKHMKRLSFITHFKIEFLVPFTSCRKVPGKKRDGLFEVTNEQQIFSKYFKSILQFLQILQDFLYIVFNEKSFNEVSLYRKYITITKQKVKIPYFTHPINCTRKLTCMCACMHVCVCVCVCVCVWLYASQGTVCEMNA